MMCRKVHAPSAYMARGLENFLIVTKEIENPFLHYTCCIVAKALGLIAVPTVLLAELVIEPLFLVKSYLEGVKENLNYSVERISKLALGILCTPLSLLAADGVSYLFLERTPTDQRIDPFGVERLYGKKLSHSIYYPSTKEEVQRLVLQAKYRKKKVSIIGAGFSQGVQTLPSSQDTVVLDLRNLKEMKFIPGSQNKLVKVGAGAIWEEVQKFVNEQGKSVIVKQASDIFSVGGSIAINCHGWEHAFGSIASTVESLEVIDAQGRLKKLSMKNPSLEDRELFRCCFGTLGYFGVIVSATLRVKENEMYQEKGVQVPISQFDSYYKKNIQNNEKVPLLMGRLSLNQRPLQEVYFNTFEQTAEKSEVPLVTKDFTFEADRGKRIERIFFDAIGHLPDFLFRPLIDWFWRNEIKLMQKGKTSSRNDIMHFGLKAFNQIHQSNLYTQWLQEYFISEEHLPSFLAFLGETLEENGVRLLNATIRPTPKDEISILPYAEKNRYAVVLSFHQMTTKKEIEKTRNWIIKVQKKLMEQGDKWYQAYMPFASKEELEISYGTRNLDRLRELKKKFDPEHLFSSQHTAKYFDIESR